MAKRGTKLLVGAVLREARVSAGLSQEALGFKAEVDRTYISYLENDLKSPTLEMLAKLCLSLDIAVSELIRRAEKK
jgi:transcriptional regulator with XRE-family HTH domain